MAYNETVNIDINANTTDAEGQVSKLENNIKTLDGAINLVGGTIEVLAGSLALSGAVTEEQAERFETAAVGAIALADGSKRIIEGYKTLATETKVLTVIQRIYNTVMKANPLFLIVGVIAAVTLGVIALTKALSKQADEQERVNKLTGKEGYIALQERQLELAKAQGESDLQLAKRKQKIIEDEIDAELLRRKEFKLGSDEFNESTQKYLELANQRKIIGIEIANLEKEEADEQATRADMVKTRAEGALVLKKKEIDFEVGLRDEYTLTANTAMTLQKQQTEVSEAEALKRQKIAETEEAYKQLLLTQGVDNIQAALSALFGESKAVASANVLIDAAQAAVGIIKNSQTTGPLAIAYQASQFALLGATTFAALQDINSAEPGSAGSPNIPNGGGDLSGGGRPQASGIPNIPGFGTSGVSTLNAVVLSGDVTSAQAQDTAIRNRRRFG